jgi:ribonuclease HI
MRDRFVLLAGVAVAKSYSARVSRVIAYTAGGCRVNPGGVGAGAFVLIDSATKVALECADAVGETTSNRMELQAVIEAFSVLRRPGTSVLVLSDSRYVVQSGSRWMAAWKKIGWKRKVGPLKNVDLLKELDRLVAPHVVEWKWVPGHAGEPGNERADTLANEAMDRLMAREQSRYERRYPWDTRLP